MQQAKNLKKANFKRFMLQRNWYWRGRNWFIVNRGMRAIDSVMVLMITRWLY